MYILYIVTLGDFPKVLPLNRMDTLLSFEKPAAMKNEKHNEAKK